MAEKRVMDMRFCFIPISHQSSIFCLLSGAKAATVNWVKLGPT